MNDKPTPCTHGRNFCMECHYQRPSVLKDADLRYSASTSSRDCPHGRQIGKCADCDVIELEAERDALRAELEAIKGQNAVKRQASKSAISSLRAMSHEQLLAEVEALLASGKEQP